MWFLRLFFLRVIAKSSFFRGIYSIIVFHRGFGYVVDKKCLLFINVGLRKKCEFFLEKVHSFSTS